MSKNLPLWYHSSNTAFRDKKMIISNNAIRQMLPAPSRFVMTAIASTVAMASMSAYANQTLTAMSVAKTTEMTTQLRLDFDDTPSTPQAYQLDNPARLVLDFPEVNNGLPSRYNQVNQGAINDVTSLNNDSTTRLIVDLADTGEKEFMTLVKGNSLLVNISDVNQAGTSQAYAMDAIAATSLPTTTQSGYVQTSYNAASAVSSDPVIQVKQTTTATPQDNMVVRVNPLLNPAYATTSQSYNYAGLNNVTYTGSSNGGGVVNIGLVNESIPIDIQRQGNKIVMRMTGATVPSNLVRQHIVSGGLISSVNARNSGKNGIVTIAMQNDFEYQAYQSGNQVTITVKPPELLHNPTIEEKQYTGEPISVDFQNVEIRSVLHLLSQFTEMNIVASDNVAGNITLNLINVPWDQALDLILKSKNLDMRSNGNVILVAPANELAEQEAKELEAQQKVEDFLPLRTEYIRLNYANAADLMTLISQGRNSGSSTNVNNDRDTGTLLSNRGTVTVDTRTNTLIIKDTSDSIENIRALISKIDIPVRQVMIEARIVSATDNFSKEMGVKWGILSNGAATNRNLLVGGSDQTLADLKDFTIESSTVNGQQQSYPSYSITRPDNLNVDLGVSNPAGRIAFGLLSMSDLMIDLELSAMQADGRGEVISTPKILTMDKQTAKVSSGTKIPYQGESEGGGTTTQFEEAVLSLEVTPNITPEGKISLKLDIENGRPNPVSDGTILIDTDTLSTNVIIDDGQTIVLGGIFRNQIFNSTEKVPFLGDMPYVGRLFKKDMRRNDKQELLIFVTPKLINDGMSRFN